MANPTDLFIFSDTEKDLKLQCQQVQSIRSNEKANCLLPDVHILKLPIEAYQICISFKYFQTHNY